METEDTLDRVCKVARANAQPCDNSTEGDEAEQFIQNYGATVGRNPQTSLIVEQFKTWAGPDQKKYHGYCIAAKVYLQSRTEAIGANRE